MTHITQSLPASHIQWEDSITTAPDACSGMDEIYFNNPTNQGTV